MLLKQNRPFFNLGYVLPMVGGDERLKKKLKMLFKQTRPSKLFLLSIFGYGDEAFKPKNEL
jgi:hypothetical protein